jgi:hypothetical protein
LLSPRLEFCRPLCAHKIAMRRYAHAAAWTPAPGHLTLALWPANPPETSAGAQRNPLPVIDATAFWNSFQLSCTSTPRGGHGYGLRRTNLPVITWPQSAETWLHTIGVLK